MILAVDGGSTNHKVALFDAQLNRLAARSLPVTYSVRTGRQVEFEPERLWQDTLALILQVCVDAKVPPREIALLTLTSQAQTFTLVDAAGKPLLPFLSWEDQRATQEAAELKRELGERFHRHCSFPAPWPQLQVAKLLWVARHLPARLRSRARLLTVPGFLAWRLAGLHCQDANLAAMSGLYSLVEKRWWPAALARCGVDSGQCGEVVEPGRPLAAAKPCPELALAPDLRVVFAGNDQTAGAWANRLAPGGMLLTLGTALVAYRRAGDAPGPFSPAGCWGPYPGGGYYELLTRDEGCLAVDWAVNQLTAGDRARFHALAAEGTSGAACFCPQRWQTAQAWAGSETPAARARAVFDALGFSLRALLEKASPQPSTECPLVLIGGGSDSPLWLPTLANSLNRAVVRGMGDSLLGAACLARPGVSPPAAAAPAAVRPEPEAVARYDRLYHAWRAFSETLAAPALIS